MCSSVVSKAILGTRDNYNRKNEYVYIHIYTGTKHV